MSIQLPDTTNTSTKVLLTDSLEVTQLVNEGTEVGVTLPVEIVPPNWRLLSRLQKC